MSVRICVNTQTPLVRFSPDLAPDPGTRGPAVLSEMVEDRDYQFSPGGVTRMVYPLLRRMINEKFVSDPCWVSLSPTGPQEAVLDGIRLSHVKIGKNATRGYGRIKEELWKVIHGLKGGAGKDGQPFWKKDYADFTYYNRHSADRMARLDRDLDFDLFYIHDFQQLAVGHMLGSLKPKLFRWHIPFDASIVPEDWKPFLLTYFNSYDMVMVSCQRYLEALRRFGFKGAVKYVFPYIDKAAYGSPAKDDLDGFCAKFGIGDKDRVILVVARLDPMKGQDGAIKAFGRVVRDHPDAKLVLAGNGSFSSSKDGIGLSKAERWKDELLRLVRELGVQDRVVFTGHISHRELEAAYTRCDMTLLPSHLEGFGLVVIEGWLYGKPAIVSSGAGVADIIVEGENGFLFDPGDTEGLAEKVRGLLEDPETAARLGRGGHHSSEKCSLEEGLKRESEVLGALMGNR